MKGNNNEGATLIKTEAELLSLVDKKLSGGTEGEITIVCAGHFMLMPDKSREKVVPGVFEGERDEYYEHAQNVIGIFPQYTWKLGCKILEQIKKLKHNGKLSLLVNDWQLVPRDNEREDSQPNKFRDNFYNNFKELPPIYKREFESHHFDFAKDIFKTDDGEFFLREVRLRDRFSRKIKNLVEKDISVPVGMCTLSLDENGNVLINIDCKPTYSLTRNWQTGCAGGLSQMVIDMSHLLNTQYKKINFINLMPKSCTVPVNIGSEFAIEILKVEPIPTSISITNFYFESYGTTEEEDFYESFGHNVTSYEY